MTTEANQLLHRARNIIQRFAPRTNGEVLAVLADTEEFLAETQGEKPTYGSPDPDALDADFVQQAYQEGYSDASSVNDQTPSDETLEDEWRRSITRNALVEMGYVDP